MKENESRHNPGQTHLESVLQNIETVNDLDVSFLLTQMNSLEFMDAFKKIIKNYKEKTGEELQVGLVFNIDDPEIEKNYMGNKQGFLRFLKALSENRILSGHITDIVVKGPLGTVDIEPNVFASGVKFEEMGD